MPELPPHYTPKDVEEARYQWWESQGLFQADADPSRPSYTIVIPPPNVTGILHMGHALNSTIQDIIIRTKRMQGYNTLWLPGTDHAGIATQNVVEKALAKEGTRRQDLGREAFVQRVWKWKEKYGNTILYQLKRLGASCDWRRTRFTMDQGLSDAVAEVFLRLHKKGLIYRGQYIINWCPRCQTALSNEEAPRQETKGKLYHIKYPLEGKKGFLEVATTRPETMLGDTAVAVHPRDKRYKALIGQHVILPIVNRRLPIIADELVDRKFGTGAVKVTPAHDLADFQMGKKHKLEFLNVMTDDAHMTGVPAPYDGLDRFDARSKLIVALEQQGVLGKIEEHLHNVGHCYRCHTAVEPRLSPQWFVKMKPLAAPAIKAVKNGTITFSPARWKKVYLNWMENIEDWCISRQIWWGHRLPVYSASSGKVTVSKTRPAGRAKLTQDEDVLDTWFSSWLWPFSTLGWPKPTKDLRTFYPTTTLVTAQEIIFFWVARMIMAGYFCMGKPPFTKVYIHGTVRDLTGKKMSKSLGNIIDPLEIIDRYGTDALRYTLVTATAIGQDIFLSEERFAAGRNFANKLWNATRYALSHANGGGGQGAGGTLRPSSVPDRWILSRLQRTIMRVTKSLDDFLFNDAASALYEFLWRDLCDWYVEITKHAEPAQRATTQAVLRTTLETSLRLLHPIMPFVTEELWQHMQGPTPKTTRKGSGSRTPASIMTAPWPKPSTSLLDPEAERLFDRFKAVVVAIRTTRAELNVPAESRPQVRLASTQAAVRSFFETHRPLLQALASIGTVDVETRRQRVKHAAATVVDGIEVLIPLEGLIDPDKERQRVRQRVQELTKHLAQLDGRLKNQEFTRKAPKEVVDQARTKRQQVHETLKKFSDHLALLKTL